MRPSTTRTNSGVVLALLRRRIDCTTASAVRAPSSDRARRGFVVSQLRGVPPRAAPRLFVARSKGARLAEGLDKLAHLAAALFGDTGQATEDQAANLVTAQGMGLGVLIRRDED